jgi:hypothetical protein
MPRKATGKPNGNPVFKPTDEERKLVEQMCAVGIPQESIALVVRDGIDDKTLRKHFRRELDTSKIKANAKVGGALFNKAMAGDTSAAIFWAKTQMGWKEIQQIDTNVSVKKVERVIVDASDSDSQSV